ncbi:hypothetical protein PTKIN_Ptkin02bG0244700 [Pterospermum kingtungense]
MMQSEQKLIDQAVDQAKSYRVNCMEMRKQVYQLSQRLRTLLYFITLNPLSPYLDPIHCVISEVSWTLQEALSLACQCRCKTIFYRLFFTEDKIWELVTVLRRLDSEDTINSRILVKEIEKVATAAVVALQKFACKHNYLHKAHSKWMIEFNANVIQALVKILLMRDGERRQQLHFLVLSCYIATNIADYSEAIKQARL